MQWSSASLRCLAASMQMRSASFMRAWPTYSASVWGRSAASTVFSSSLGCVVTMRSGMLLRQLLQRLANDIGKVRLAVAACQHLLHDFFRFGRLVAKIGQGREGVVHEPAGRLGGLCRAVIHGTRQLLDLVLEFQRQAPGRLFADARHGRQHPVIVVPDG